MIRLVWRRLAAFFFLSVEWRTASRSAHPDWTARVAAVDHPRTTSGLITCAAQVDCARISRSVFSSEASPVLTGFDPRQCTSGCLESSNTGSVELNGPVGGARPHGNRGLWLAGRRLTHSSPAARTPRCISRCDGYAVHADRDQFASRPAAVEGHRGTPQFAVRRSRLRPGPAAERMLRAWPQSGLELSGGAMDGPGPAKCVIRCDRAL